MTQEHNTDEPSEQAKKKNNPIAQDEFTSTLLNWMRHYWDAPREKSKWTDVALVILTTATAFAAFYTAYIFDGQLIEMQRATVSAEKNFRVDQRAWMNIRVGQAPLVDGKPILMPIQSTNTGKTPALHVEGTIIVNLLHVGEEPDFVYKPGHPGYTVNTGFVAPKSPEIVPLAVLPKYLPINAPFQRTTVTRPIRQGISKGTLYITVHGRITYTDIFQVHHWLNFCTFAENAPPTGTAVNACAEYNQADND